MSHHYILFRDVRFSYPGYGPEVLKGISFRITHGEKVALVGLNGAGKSTLLLHVNGLLLPSSGEVNIGDVPVTKKTLPLIRQNVGMVFQNPDDQLFMPTVGEDVAFGPRSMSLPEEEVGRRVTAALRQVGLDGFEERSPSTLSGGQRRMAAIAAVLSMEPNILVLDEPTSNLDWKARRRVVETIKDFGHTCLVATHDLALIKEVCARTIVIDDGRILADTLTERVFSDRSLLETLGL